jgi:hypothetical protein
LRNLSPIDTETAIICLLLYALHYLRPMAVGFLQHFLCRYDCRAVRVFSCALVRVCF